MNQAKINNRLKNLKNVKAIVEIAKIDTIKKIARSNNVKSLHYEIAEISQQIINYSKQFNKIRTWKKSIKQTKFKQTKSLWIFITLPSALLKMSYSKYETIIEKNIDSKMDSMIAIGDPAIDFAHRKGYNVLTTLENLENSVLKLSSIIIHEINNQKFQRVLIVSQEARTKKSFYKLYPFEDVKYNLKEMKKRKFFYSLSNTREQIFYNYVKNIIGGIYQESYWNFYVEKLAKHESSLNSIDEKIEELKILLAKIIRKKETEEMIHITQFLKRM